MTRLVPLRGGRWFPSLGLPLAGAAAVLLALSSPAWAGLSVGRSAFCRSVEAREPVGVADTFPADVGEVTFFTQILGAEGSQQILHVWIYDGREMAIVPLDVEGPSWRTWSTKRILPEWKGDWIVEVRTVDGAVLHEARMRIE
ncbi:DUF2914 domain-containing protein [Deferrisoma camini]|uniref:DUF2914 domain-containing protein n=1 Tax=Deferrisoma camini TaxID=1035120 RepID=UPI00046CC603|nr:DUF2914 domain-containing protein [Deferrisoma camini]